MEVPRGFTRCDECEGGLVCGCERGKHDPHPRDAGHTMFIDRFDGVPCPSCSGSGLVPTEKLREDVAREIYELEASWIQLKEDPWDVVVKRVRDNCLRRADAVLAKVAEHLGGRE